MERRIGADALPGWRETPAKQAVLDFVHAVTAPESPDFVAEPDRIAVFDNDGTLWTERPVYAQLAFALDRAAELGHPASPDQLRAGGLAALPMVTALVTGFLPMTVVAPALPTASRGARPSCAPSPIMFPT